MAAECVIFAVHGSLSASANIIQNDDQRKKEAFLLNIFSSYLLFSNKIFSQNGSSF